MVDEPPGNLARNSGGRASEPWTSSGNRESVDHRLSCGVTGESEEGGDGKGEKVKR